MPLIRHLLLALLSVTAAHAEDLQLTLPPTLYATPGVEMNIYHDNIVLTQTPENYRFEVRCPIGSRGDRRWTMTPTDQDVGNHPVEIVVKDQDGKVLESGRLTLHVSPRKAGEGKTLRLLMVGDSLTHGSLYPNEIAKLLTRPSNPKWTTIGTHQPASALPDVRHEG